MDPVCHTLVGAALARSGLGRASDRATAALVIAANVPDVDVFALWFDRNIELRRGVTHGVPALLLWPLLLGGLFWWWNRWRPGGGPNRFWPLVAVSALGVITHPFLDYLNVYGMRWLMPIVDRWYYGDSLFIVDPWLYLALGVGVALSLGRSRRGRPAAGPARVGLALAAVYVGVMMVLGQLARGGITRALADTPLAGARFMAAPVFANPLIRDVIVDAGSAYRLGRYRPFASPALSLETTVDKGSHLAPLVDRSSLPQSAAAFFRWSRFPVLVAAGDGRMGVYDLRYARDLDSFAATVFTVSRHGEPPPPAPADSTTQP